MTRPPARQREHQANERTFLAWLRTSIARFGLFLPQLRVASTHQELPINPVFDSEKLGVSLVIFGIVAFAH